jgi:AAA+ superfamily predicted ATPase
LIFIEHDKSNSLIIAATNYPQNLDYALFRRFHSIIEYKLPDVQQIKLLLKNRFYRKELNQKDINKVAKEADGLSYGELTSICDEAFKDMIINEYSAINTDDLLSLIKEKKIIRNIKSNNNG